MSKTFSGLLAIAIAAVSLPVLAQDTAPARYVVAAKVFANGEVIGSPRLTVTAGQQTAIQVSGERGYALEVVVDDDGSRSTTGEALRLNSRLYFRQDSDWVLVGAPQISMVEGTSARLSSSSPTVYGDGGYALEVDVVRAD